MIFDGSMFQNYIMALLYGVATGFTIGFIAWAVGFAIYGIIKIIKAR